MDSNKRYKATVSTAKPGKSLQKRHHGTTPGATGNSDRRHGETKASRATKSSPYLSPDSRIH